MKYAELSPTQQLIVRIMKASPNMINSNLGGDSRIHRISAARALVRKDILIEYRTSHFAVRDRNAEIWKEVPTKK